MAARKAKQTTYVKTAQRLLKRSPIGEVSAGQVAFHAHRKTPSASQFDFEADQALSECGLFVRACFINANSMGITTWKAKT